ncbi:transposase [Siccirubricoccus sp. G192]|uniref:transposase n=1 Tax=Siccirubricoccus sp. G192 TaxID=2849651 RepID=UPI0028123D6C|nr:transposase [Siccirubricoccus sp. G192]
MIGLAEHPGFAAFHRVLNRNAWSGLALARILLRQVVAAFVPAGPIVIGVDHTLERRRGRHIGPAGHFYDAGRSSPAWQATSRGLRWLSAMVLVEVPFAGHVWALPVLTALTPSKTWSEQHGQRHRPVTDWARRLLLTPRRWLPDRTIVAVMDGEFAALELLHALRSRMVVITRLRRDARLFDPPGEWDRRGRPALKGGSATHADRTNHRSRDALAPHRAGQPCGVAQCRLDRIHRRHGALAPLRQADRADPVGAGPLPGW